MKEYLYYEDIALDSDVPVLLKQPTTTQLVMWAGASGDYYPIHYDKDYAQQRGLPGVIVHGQLVGGFLGQMMTDWLGEWGQLRKLSCSYRAMNFPGEPITCGGKVGKKYIRDGEHFLECNVWVENAQGEKTVTGTAVVLVPARSAVKNA